MATRTVQIGFLISGITSASTGLPVNGGTVEFYEAGTTTPKYVYTDKDKTTGHYSYDLDAIGAAQLYAEGEYKIVIKDSAGSAVKTYDYIRLRYDVYGVDTVSTSPHTMTQEDDLLLLDTTSGSITINALPASEWVRPLKVFRYAGANSWTFNPDGAETIDGDASLTVTSGAIVEFMSDGSNILGVGFRSNMADSDDDTKIEVEETADDDTIRFDTAGTERMQIGPTGNVGIGKASGGAKLDVDGEVEATALDINGNADVSGTAAVHSTAEIHDTLTLSKASGNGLVVTADIDANGAADIAGTLTLSKATGNGLVVTAAIDANGTADIADTLTLSKASGNGLVVTADADINGNVDIAGTLRVNSHQDLDGDTKIQVEEGADDDTIRFDTGGSERVRIGSDGVAIVGNSTAKIESTTDLDRYFFTIQPEDDATSAFVMLFGDNDTVTPGEVLIAGSDGASATTGIMVGQDGTVNCPVALQIAGTAHGTHTGDVTGGEALTIANAAVSQAKLKTSTGSVNTTSETEVYLTLPGGEYGFYPRLYVDNAAGGAIASLGATTSTTAVAIIGLRTGSSSYIAYATQRYITSSGEVYWYFVLRDKTTKKPISSYAAPDHPCFGNGGDPNEVPHPFPDYDPAIHEIVVVNPDTDTLKEILGRKGKRDVLRTLEEDYEIEDTDNDWPTTEVTVGLPGDIDFYGSVGERGAEVQPVKRAIPRPGGVLCKKIRLKSIQQR